MNVNVFAFLTVASWNDAYRPLPWRWSAEADLRIQLSLIPEEPELI